MINESHDSVNEISSPQGYSKSNRTQITNWEKLVLQVGAALFYYKLGQTLLQIGATTITKWGSYY